MIRTDSDEYFIEPLVRGTQELEDQGRVHVVYRRSAVLQAPSDISVDYQPQGRTRDQGDDLLLGQAAVTVPLWTKLCYTQFLLHVGVQKKKYCLAM